MFLRPVHVTSSLDVSHVIEGRDYLPSVQVSHTYTYTYTERASQNKTKSKYEKDENTVSQKCNVTD